MNMDTDSSFFSRLIANILSIVSLINDTFFSSPLNIILSLICVYLFYRIFRNSKENFTTKSDVEILPPLEKHDMNLEELRKYDGHGPDGRVCVAINGKIYDCSKSDSYRPGGPYANFAGHDITRALAKFDVTMVKDEWDDCSDLESEEISSVNEWDAQFEERYELVGKLIKDLKEPKLENQEENKEK